MKSTLPLRFAGTLPTSQQVTMSNQQQPPSVDRTSKAQAATLSRAQSFERAFFSRFHSKKNSPRHQPKQPGLPESGDKTMGGEIFE